MNGVLWSETKVATRHWLALGAAGLAAGSWCFAAPKPQAKKPVVTTKAAANGETEQPRLFATINAKTRNNAASKESVLLADNKVAKLPIIIAANASKETETLAGEVASTLEEITGAKFQLSKGDEGAGIIIGTLAEFPTPSAEAGLQIFGNYDGREAFAIRTENNSVKIIGATQSGMAFGVTRFLETLGCRWFFQSPAWNVVPKAAKLSFNSNQTDRPELVSRYFGYPAGVQFEKSDPDAGAANLTWWWHNYVGKSLRTEVGHCASNIRIRFKDEFAKHPEYTALVNDQRTPGDSGQLCLSNPDVQKLAAQYAVEYFDKHPEADMVGMGPDDGGNWCQCDVCKAQFRNPGDGAFFLANVAAKALQKEHPGKLVGIYAYNWHCDPPPFPMERNIYVEITTAMLLNTRYTFEELLELWPQKVGYVGVYDYWAVYDWTRDALPAGRTANTRYVAQQLPDYIQHGICGLTAESGTSWGGHGLGYYLASRVLWNSKSDIAALRQDFLQKAFGPAAGEMKTYFTRVDAASAPLPGPTFYRLAIDDLDRAETAAGADAEVLARIRQLKMYHVFLYLNNRVDASFHNMKTATPALDPQREQSVYNLIRWNYRIRNTYMTFWDFFADQSARRFAAEFKKPEWNFSHMRYQGKADQIPYRDNPREPTSEEVDKVLAQAKAFYGEPNSMDDEKWATAKDFVAPSWPAPKGTPGKVMLQTPHTLLIEGKAATPLTFTIWHGTIYEGKGDGTYTVRDEQGTLIATGRVPYGTHTVEVKVPRDAFYYVHYDDSDDAGWHFIPRTGVRSAFVLERGKKFNIHGGSFWFYVPKGTKEIRMYAMRTGYSITLNTPDGNTAGNIPGRLEGQTDVNSDGSVSLIPVPEGTDGKLWSSSNMVGGSFYFFNIPNVMLTSPDGPILPRELAEKEDLDFR